MLKVLGNWIERYLSDEEAVLLTAVFLLLLVTLWWLGEVLAPFIASLVIAYILQGIVNVLQRRNCNHLVAVSIAFVLFLGGFIALALFVIPPLWDQLGAIATDLPAMVAQGQSAMMALPEKYPALISEEHIQTLFRHINDEVAGFGESLLRRTLSGLPGLFGLVIYLVLVPIMVFFLLRDWPKLVRFTAVIVPSKRKAMSSIMREMDVQIANYIRGKAVEILIVGSVAFGLFSLFGLRYAVLLALLVGCSVLIPYIGAFAVTVPVAVVAFFQWGWSGTFVWLLLLYVLLQVLDGNVLVPLIFSEIVNLHPIAIILAILVFGGIWGFWGVFFAIPLATLVKAVISAWPVKHGLASDNVPAE